MKKVRDTIKEHISNIFKEEELKQNEECRNFRNSANNGKNYDTKYYNLDVIISVGYPCKIQTRYSISNLTIHCQKQKK